MKFKKVLISLMLSLAMVFTALPAMAFADDESPVDPLTPVPVEDGEEETWSEIKTQLYLAEMILDTLGNASAEEFRAVSIAAISKAKVKCNNLIDDIWDLVYEGIDENQESIKALFLDLSEAIKTLQTVCEQKEPKIKNYIKLAKNVSRSNVVKVKVKKLREKSVQFKPLVLTAVKGIPAYKDQLTYAAKMLNKKAKKYLKFNKKTGKITIKKGAKKGTYKIRVTARAAGNGDYKPYQFTKVIRVKVR